jgi:ACT domain-containing protein
VKSKRGQLRTKTEKQALINKVDLYRFQDFKVSEAFKEAGISYRTYFQYKKEIKNGAIEDGG